MTPTATAPEFRAPFEDLFDLLNLDSPGEDVGFLLEDGSGAIVRVIPATNSSPFADAFRLGRPEMSRGRAEAKKLGLRFGGILHTHPWGPGAPSSADMRFAGKRGVLVRMIWSIPDRALIGYDCDGERWRVPEPEASGWSKGELADWEDWKSQIARLAPAK